MIQFPRAASWRCINNFGLISLIANPFTHKQVEFKSIKFSFLARQFATVFQRFSVHSIYFNIGQYKKLTAQPSLETDETLNVMFITLIIIHRT
jgi:hypothetical protein